MQGRMAIGFVDLEMAYDPAPTETVTATVRCVGVQEAEAVKVEAMYEITKGRDGSGLSEEFPINIGLRQGSVYCLLFIVLKEQHQDQHE